MKDFIKYNQIIDLHTHSTASDGTCSPSEVVALAKNAGLSAIALTDHDTFAGILEAQEAGKVCGLPVLAGVEMSCAYKNGEIHILGYLLSHFMTNKKISPKIYDDLAYFSSLREKRNIEIMQRLEKDGIIVTKEDLHATNPDGQITRAHFANVLEKKGYVKDKKEAFEYYLCSGGKYIPPKTLDIPTVFSFFKKYHFFVSLAHPFLYKLSEDELHTLLKTLCHAGMQGIEVYHSTHTEADSRKLLSLAKMYHLLPTGGSDFHGENKPNLYIGKGYGSLRVGGDVLADMIRTQFK